VGTQFHSETSFHKMEIEFELDCSRVYQPVVEVFPDWMLRTTFSAQYNPIKEHVHNRMLKHQILVTQRYSSISLNYINSQAVFNIHHYNESSIKET